MSIKKYLLLILVFTSVNIEKSLAQATTLTLTSPQPLNSQLWGSGITFNGTSGTTPSVRHLIVNQNYLRIIPGAYATATDDEKKVVVEGSLVVAKFGNLTNPPGYSLYVREGILSQGKVMICDNSGIIPATPAGYNLYVSDGILTEKVKVAVKTTLDWKDFVFNDDYKLSSLNDVEVFIKKNKHLPDVPSAEEMVINGLDVQKMDALLLQKIEELTLYLIEMKKQNEKMQAEILLLQGKN
jgi:hypothetical protein